MNNILITSAGKRVTLVEQFKRNLKVYFPESEVMTTDMNPEMAPACIISDRSFKVPRVDDKDYIIILLNLCMKNGVRIVIPTIDTELQVLADNKKLFGECGIDILVSCADFISLCRDKRNTNDFFVERNIRIPKPVSKNDPTYPFFAKPYDGSLSKDLFIVKSEEEYTDMIRSHPKLIFMEYIDKSVYKEFTVDMYYGKDNRVKSIVPRERLEIRAGEINKGITRKNFLIEYLLERMNHIPGVTGCICIQLFYKEEDNDIVAIEINPRFGGGYPLSYHAGANYPEYIIKEYLLNESIYYNDQWKDNTLFLRYDQEVVVYAE